MRKRLNVHLYVTPICNLKRKHCYYEAKDMKYNLDDILSIEELKYIIVNLVDNYDVYFDIEGGELFLRDDIEKLFLSLDDKYLNRITITTNGTINFDTTQFYLKKLDEFRISFESDNNNIQKQIRGIGLEGPLKLAKDLLKNRIEPTIRVTIHKFNFNDIINLIDFYKNMGFKKFSFYEFQTIGYGIENQELALNDNDFILLIDTINHLNFTDIDIKFSFSKVRQQYKNKITNLNIIDFGNVDSLTIDYNGDIGVCPWQKDRFDKFNMNSFNKLIKEKINNDLLSHECNYCSAFRIINA